MSRSVAVWFTLAGLAGGWSLLALGGGGAAFLPGLLAVIALGCAVNAGCTNAGPGARPKSWAAR